MMAQPSTTPEVYPQSTPPTNSPRDSPLFTRKMTKEAGVVDHREHEEGSTKSNPDFAFTHPTDFKLIRKRWSSEVGGAWADEESIGSTLPCGMEETELVSEVSDADTDHGSWYLPSGPVAWEDTDKAFDQLLNYADLTLTEEEENGVLTDRIIAACASYLTRTPASKCYVIAKLSLDNKNLSDIRIIALHRFLQYVDLSWNNIKDLSPLGNLPYLMYLDVSHNMLEEVLRFQPPWNLTYVNYSYNEVWQIDDLSDFWSLTYLDLSHNKISKIQGLESLRYLRYLNLSHNKITRFENLNNSRITDLNLEYNIISSFEMGENVGMKTLLNLSSLCLNNNLISDLEFLKGVYHLKKLELQGNRISNLLGLSHMQTLRKLQLLDLTGNPVCEYKPYRHVLLNILPEIRFLDQTEVHSSEKLATFVRKTLLAPLRAAQGNARMTLLDQLNDDVLDLDVIPIDQGAYPMVILVGPSASGKKTLVTKLAEKYPDKIFIGKIHTTRDLVEKEKKLLIKLSREEFNEKIKNGHFYCLSEKLGNFYAFSKEMLAHAVKSHKLCLTFMSLDAALMILEHGIRAHLVLTMPSSEEEHRMRLKQDYGPVITYLGAAYLSKRELKNTHASNMRRVQEIILDVVEEVIYWVEERHRVRFAPISDTELSFRTPDNRGRETDNSLRSAKPENRVKSSDTSTKEIPVNKKFECPKNCSPSICGLQKQFKELAEANQDVTDFSFSTDNTNFDEMKDEGSGTCSTSYSTVIPPPLRFDHTFDEEGSFGGEDDIFADWTSPFIDWDELNVDPKALEDVAESLCQSFADRVLAARAIYENIHHDNPGLFLSAFFTDDIEDTVKKLGEFLKDVWRSAPTKKPVFHIEKDYAYKEMVPKRLAKLKEMIRGERYPGYDEHCSETYAKVRSPRTIITQMQLMGYEEPGE